jgi:hypothetical protein
MSITGTVVPAIVEELVRKDPGAEFYFAIRRDAAATSITARFEAVLSGLGIERDQRDRLRVRSGLIEIDITREGLGI